MVIATASISKPQTYSGCVPHSQSPLILQLKPASQSRAHSRPTQLLSAMVTPAQMASSRSISLKCPVPLCTRQFKTNRAKDCLRVHLRYSKDEDHKDIYIARYSDHQRTNAAIYPCPICRQTFEKPSGLKRHYVSIRKYSLESRLRVVNI